MLFFPLRFAIFWNVSYLFSSGYGGGGGEERRIEKEREREIVCVCVILSLPIKHKNARMEVQDQTELRRKPLFPFSPSTDGWIALSDEGALPTWFQSPQY